jgi:hypothetical protein
MRSTVKVKVKQKLQLKRPAVPVVQKRKQKLLIKWKLLQQKRKRQNKRSQHLFDMNASDFKPGAFFYSIMYDYPTEYLGK